MSKRWMEGGGEEGGGDGGGGGGGGGGDEGGGQLRAWREPQFPRDIRGVPGPAPGPGESKNPDYFPLKNAQWKKTLKITSASSGHRVSSSQPKSVCLTKD